MPNKKSKRQKRQAKLAKQAEEAAGYQDDDNFSTDINLSPEGYKKYLNLGCDEANIDGTQVPKGLVKDRQNTYLKRIADSNSNLPPILGSDLRSGRNRKPSAAEPPRGNSNMALLRPYDKGVNGHRDFRDSLEAKVTVLKDQEESADKQKEVSEWIRKVKNQRKYLDSDLDLLGRKAYADGITEEKQVLIWEAIDAIRESGASIEEWEEKLTALKTIDAVPPGRLARLDMPIFDGNIVDYQSWKTDFLALTGGVDAGAKRAYLLKALAGEAKDWVKELVERNQPAEEIWKSLDAHYGDPKNVSDITL